MFPTRFAGPASRGFTLTELLIVVAIIGILAAIAIPNFLRYQLRARRSEGATNVAALRTAQVAHFGVRNAFVSPSNPNPPAHPFDGQRHPWDHTDPEWRRLGYEPEGDVYFQYSTEADGPTFFILGVTDLDVDGAFACWTFAKPEYDTDGNPSSSFELPPECADATELDDDGNPVPVKLEYDKVDLVTGDARY